jgi:hypothetical protein
MAVFAKPAVICRSIDARPKLYHGMVRLLVK